MWRNNIQTRRNKHQANEVRIPHRHRSNVCLVAHRRSSDSLLFCLSAKAKCCCCWSSKNVGVIRQPWRRKYRIVIPIGFSFSFDDFFPSSKQSLSHHHHCCLFISYLFPRDWSSWTTRLARPRRHRVPMSTQPAAIDVMCVHSAG